MDQRTAQSDLRAAKSFGRFPDLEPGMPRWPDQSREGRRDSRLRATDCQREQALGEFISMFIDLAQRVTVSDLKRALELWAESWIRWRPTTTKRRHITGASCTSGQFGSGIKLDGFFGGIKV